MKVRNEYKESEGADIKRRFNGSSVFVGTEIATTVATQKCSQRFVRGCRQLVYNVGTLYPHS